MGGKIDVRVSRKQSVFRICVMEEKMFVFTPLTDIREELARTGPTMTLFRHLYLQKY